MIEARRILAHVERAVAATQHAADPTPILRVGVVDASYDSMPQILQLIQERYPDLEIHQMEMGVPAVTAPCAGPPSPSRCRPV